MTMPRMAGGPTLLTPGVIVLGCAALAVRSPVSFSWLVVVAALGTLG